MSSPLRTRAPHFSTTSAKRSSWLKGRMDAQERSLHSRQALTEASRHRLKVVPESAAFTCAINNRARKRTSKCTEHNNELTLPCTPEKKKKRRRRVIVRLNTFQGNPLPKFNMRKGVKLFQFMCPQTRRRAQESVMLMVMRYTVRGRKSQFSVPCESAISAKLQKMCGKVGKCFHFSLGSPMEGREGGR